MKVVNIYTYSTAKSPKAAKSLCEAVAFVIEYQDSPDKAFPQMKIIKEMTAYQSELYVLERALSRIKTMCEVHVYTECEYIAAGFEQGRLEKWKKNGWKTAKNKDVSNLQEWKALDALVQEHGHKLVFHVKEDHSYRRWLKKQHGKGESEMQETYETGKIVMIDPKHIHPHPNNPRKQLGDLTELRASVKKNGIMQNLTVIPMDEAGEYMALIGHRRSEAARLEELEAVPCIIKEGLSELEQLNIMMEENMQRNDLTIYEQAQGFQMMLDLGGTAESISQKSGFSISTVYHRLNIAKLNQNELKKREKEDGFQLSLKDLYELEQISDIKKRDEVLKNARDSKDLAWRAKQTAREEKRSRAFKEIAAVCKKQGMEKTPEDATTWSNEWSEVKKIDLDEGIPKRINVKDTEPLFYKRSGQYLCIFKKVKKEKKVKTAAELKRDQINKNKKRIESLLHDMNERRRELVLEVIAGSSSRGKEDGETKDAVWSYLFKNGALNCYRSTLEYYYTQKQNWDCTAEEKEKRDCWINSLSIMQQYLVVLCIKLGNAGACVNYDGEFVNSDAVKIKEGHAILEKYGWYFTEEEQQLLDGTHELYEKKEEEQKNE